MAEKKIAQNQGNSGRINLSGSELNKFKAKVGDTVEVDIAESENIAHAMIKNKDSEEYIIISKTPDQNTEEKQ
jgi:hypothetical protein